MTQQKVLVIVLDVNDNPPKFPFKVRVWSVSEVSVRGWGIRSPGLRGLGA